MTKAGLLRAGQGRARAGIRADALPDPTLIWRDADEYDESNDDESGAGFGKRKGTDAGTTCAHDRAILVLPRLASREPPSRAMAYGSKAAARLGATAQALKPPNFHQFIWVTRTIYLLQSKFIEKTGSSRAEPQLAGVHGSARLGFKVARLGLGRGLEPSRGNTRRYMMLLLPAAPHPRLVRRQLSIHHESDSAGERENVCTLMTGTPVTKPTPRVLLTRPRLTTDVRERHHGDERGLLSGRVPYEPMRLGFIPRGQLLLSFTEAWLLLVKFAELSPQLSYEAKANAYAHFMIDMPPHERRAMRPAGDVYGDDGDVSLLMANHAAPEIWHVLVGGVHLCLNNAPPYRVRIRIGYGGMCSQGKCMTGSLFDTAKAWYTQNLEITIPVTVVAGLFIIRGILRCIRGRDPALRGDAGPPIGSARYERLKSLDDGGFGADVNQANSSGAGFGAVGRGGCHKQMTRGLSRHDDGLAMFLS
ncbi:hypothetical protein C8J56DRAFT_1027206 [Mycena floridula]|nr:hypothetical protein C8J56DRAFT_1027206 [Mycena floridula]